MEIATFPHNPLDAQQSSTQLSTGVYFLFLGGELTYVGRSRDCRARIAAHRTNGRPFDRHLIAPCSMQDAEWVERAMLQAMEPVQNRILYTSFRKPAPAPKPVVQAMPGEHPKMLLNKPPANGSRKHPRTAHLRPSQPSSHRRSPTNNQRG